MRSETVHERLSPAEFLAAEGVDGWRILGDGACACFRTGSFAHGARFVAAIGEAVDRDGLDDHHLDVDLRTEQVTVRLATVAPGYFGVSHRDLDLARRIAELGRDHGVAPDPTALRSVQVTVDALDHDAVVPFWEAVLGYADRGDGGGGTAEDLADPGRRSAPLWFQRMEAPRTGRNRLHIDVWVPVEEASRRIEAAIAAGGQLVSDADAPAWWVLADPEGNEACVATAQGREGP